MTCPYANNPLCASIPPDTLKLMCERCRVREFPKGRLDRAGYWCKGTAFVVSGLTVLRHRDGGEYRTTGIASPGNLIGGGVMLEYSNLIANEYNLFVTDTKLAMLDAQDTTELLELPGIKQAFLDEAGRSMSEKNLFAANVLAGDAYTAVRHILDYCRRRGVGQLTHEQISTVSNRRRPTVTKVLHDIAVREPELLAASIPV